MGLQEYVDSIKASASSLASKAALSYLYAQAPYLKAPIVNLIVEFLVKKVVNAVIDSTEIAAFFVYTDVRVNKQGIAFTEAAYKHREAQLNGTEEEKAMAEQTLMDAFRKFVVLTN